jgi:hypothetical protein
MAAFGTRRGSAPALGLPIARAQARGSGPLVAPYQRRASAASSACFLPTKAGYSGAIRGMTTVIKKLALWVGGVITLLLIFSVADLPQTVRLKAAIVRILPLDPESIDSTIRSLCAGLHSGSAVTDCYLTFRSEKAVKAIADEQARKRKCQQIAHRIESGEEKGWLRQEPRSREEIVELLKPFMEDERDPKSVREYDNSLLYLYCWR